jgi:hypothetical protein
MAMPPTKQQPPTQTSSTSPPAFAPPSDGGPALTDAGPPQTRQYKSNEGYISGTEPRDDAAFHAEMLEGPQAEAADRITSLQSAIRLVEQYGASEEVAAELYGIDLATLEAGMAADGEQPMEPASAQSPPAEAPPAPPKAP